MEFFEQPGGISGFSTHTGFESSWNALCQHSWQSVTLRCWFVSKCDCNICFFVKIEGDDKVRLKNLTQQEKPKFVYDDVALLNIVAILKWN